MCQALADLMGQNGARLGGLGSNTCLEENLGSWQAWKSSCKKEPMWVSVMPGVGGNFCSRWLQSVLKI